MNQDDLSRFNKRTIISAGPRYTPALEKGAPNLEIESLIAATDGLIASVDFAKQVMNCAAELQEKWSRAKNSFEVSEKTESLVTKLGQVLNDLAALAIGCSSGTIRRAKLPIGRIEQSIAVRLAELEAQARQIEEEIRKTHADDPDEIRSTLATHSALSDIRGKENALYRLTSAVRDIETFLQSLSCQLRFKNVGILVGVWGTGKTHFLCDVADRLGAKKKPALVILAKDFSVGSKCGDSLARATGFATTFGELLSAFHEAGKAAGQRALLLVDGINESDMEAWKRDLPAMIREAREYSHVGLILSFRKPFEEEILSASLRKALPILEHPGFDDLEFDAQKAFFGYYKIPLPEVPLLADEFSRPLTLKILCQAFQKLPKKERKSGFHGLSSGQKGMTFILEHFVYERTKAIERDHGLPAKTCWSVVKGEHSIAAPELAGFAPYMATHGVDAIPRKSALRILAHRSPIGSMACANEILKLLVREGIVYEHMRWQPKERGGPQRVIGLPYQRFTDHIIARFLLNKYLDRGSAAAVAASFSLGTPLGRIFHIKDKRFARYESENLAEAVIVEFPEFTKTVLPNDERELFFHLPPESQSIGAYLEPFVGGFVWRSPTAFCKKTDRISGYYFWSKNENVRGMMSEALVSVSTKPLHPYSGTRLFRNIAKVEMPKRDLLWSEYLRKHRVYGTAVERFVTFYEGFSSGSLSYETAVNAIAVLSTFLTTTDRRLRDRATKALVIIGERQPSALFMFVRDSLLVDDPYLRERLLAAAFGVCMSKYAESPGSFADDHKNLAQWVLENFFMPGGVARTHHTLIREYASGIIELHFRRKRGAMPMAWKRYAQPPYKGLENPFPDSRGIHSRVSKRVGHAVQMDFANDNLGRLVKGRQNHDYKHAGLKRIQRQIEWRIDDLGYREKLFKDIDVSIGRDSWRGGNSEGKVDRYGEKYAWIAYFEMYGLRQAHAKGGDESERTTDCDIDPSFPANEGKDLPPVNWAIPTGAQVPNDIVWLRDGVRPDYSSLLCVDVLKNEQGPWVLVEGHIREQDSATGRRLWTAIDAMAMHSRDVAKFERKFLEGGHPGGGFRDGGTDHYMYAGEVGWSREFGRDLRRKNGALPSPDRKMFPTYEQRQVKEKIKAAWRYFDGNILLDYENARTASARKRTRKSLVRHVDWVNEQVPKKDRLSWGDLSSFSLPSRREREAGYRLVPRHVSVNAIRVESMARSFGWESYHSQVNDYSGFSFPSPWICEALGLHSRNRSIDLFDASGRRATLCFDDGLDSWKESTELLYVRKDLLESYLEKRGKTFVWVLWGEREVDMEGKRGFPDEAGIFDVYQSQLHLHKKIIRP